MILNNCSVKFYLDQTRVRHDGHPIFCRIIIDRKKAEFKLPFHCCLSDWDHVSAQPKPRGQDAHLKIAEINRIQSIINNAIHDANRAGKVITCHELKQAVINPGTKRHTLISLGEEVISNYEKSQQAPAVSFCKGYPQ